MSLKVLEGMIGEFIERTYGCFGNLARPNHTFFSLEMVALSLAPLRDAKARGKSLTPRGELLRRIRARQELLVALDREALLEIVVWARRPVRRSSGKEALAISRFRVGE